MKQIQHFSLENLIATVLLCTLSSKWRLVPLLLLVFQLFTTAATSQSCPERCECRPDNLDGVGPVYSVDCASNGLTSVPDLGVMKKAGPSYSGSEGHKSGAKVIEVEKRIKLHLELNLISSLNKDQFPIGFDVFSLDLSRNKRLLNIPDDTFNNLAPTLEQLSLEALSLTFDRSLPMVSELSKLKFLSISHNNRKGYVPGATENVSVRLFRGPVTKSLKTLKMSHCGLRSLNESSLRGLSSLETLDLSNNWFTEVPDAVKSLHHLKTLSLFHCYIKKLADFSFSGMRELKSLLLSANHLNEIEPFAFTGLKNSLEDLRLGRCHLTTVPTNALQSLKKLKYLDLSENRFKEAGRGAFKGSYCLRDLLISARSMVFSTEAFADQSDCVVSLTIKQMDLTSIPRKAVSKLTNLRRLSLDNNQLRALPPDAFTGIAASSIRLTGNPLTTIEDNAFRGLPSGLDINLSRTKISGIDFLLGYPGEAITSVNLDYAGLVCRCSMRDALNATLTVRIYGSCRSGNRDVMLSSNELPQIVEDACTEESKQNDGHRQTSRPATLNWVAFAFILFCATARPVFK